MKSLVEVCDTQNEIIRLQSDIIDSLFARLSQILTVEELDTMPELEQIEKVIRLRGQENGAGLHYSPRV